MSWNRDFTDAPKNEVRDFTTTHHASGKPVHRTIKVKKPILISAGNEVLYTFWSEDRQQWSGLAEGQEPDAWQRVPEPAGAA